MQAPTPHRDAGVFPLLPAICSSALCILNAISIRNFSRSTEAPSPHSGFSIPIFPFCNHFEAFTRARHILFPSSSSSSSSSASSPTILCLPQSPRGVLAKMEMEEIADKNDVEVNVLGKNPSLRSTQRFPRDEAVLARFGKQQQFRVSSPLQLSSFRAALAGRARIIPESLVANTRCCAQRGFGLLPVIGLTSTLMITWEVITSSVDVLLRANSLLRS